MAALLLAMGTIAHARTWSDWWNDTKQHVSKHKGKYIAAALGGTAVYLNRDRLGSYWAGRPTEVQLKKNRPVLENEEYKPTTHKELPDKDYSIEPDKKKLEKQEAIELDKKNDEIQEAIDINRKYGPNRNLSWKDFFKELFYGPTPTMPFDQRKALHEQDNDQAKQAFQKQKEMREQNKKHTYSAKKEEQRKQIGRAHV